MSFSSRIALRSLNYLLLQDLPGFLAPSVVSINYQSTRYRQTKHWDPKWKTFRRLKIQKVKLPDYQERHEDLPEVEIRKRLRENGMIPEKTYTEREYAIHSTGGIFEAYVPPEGDGKVSPISKQGAMQNITFLEKKTKTMMAIRKVRQFEEDFDTPAFCKEAMGIYIKVHELMMASDRREELIDYVTERAYPKVIHNLYNKTIRWRYISEIELPRVVQARCVDIISKENVFAQLTVRFHTKQSLAIYDRFGRLMHGSEILAKDVLEYVVFEKHIANEYGKWRIHGKIIPDWLPPREPSPLTFIKRDNARPGPDKAVVDSVVGNKPTEAPGAVVPAG